MQRSPKDIVAGLVFVAFGLAFASIGSTYSIGTALRMGPGYFPVVLGALLALLGAGIIVEGLVNGDQIPAGSIPWRGIVLLTAAVLFFGFSVRRLGLAPSLFVTVLLAAVSSGRTSLAAALVISISLTLFCILIFVEALGMPVPLVGPWLRF
jgi:hypothetical protein